MMNKKTIKLNNALSTKVDGQDASYSTRNPPPATQKASTNEAVKKTSNALPSARVCQMTYREMCEHPELIQSARPIKANAFNTIQPAS